MWFKIPRSNSHFLAWLPGNNTSITALTAQFKSHLGNLEQLDIFDLGDLDTFVFPLWHKVGQYVVKETQELLYKAFACV